VRSTKILRQRRFRVALIRNIQKAAIPSRGKDTGCARSVGREAMMARGVGKVPRQRRLRRNKNQ